LVYLYGGLVEMTGNEKFQYPGGDSIQITLNYMWQCQTAELARQGLVAEYEDMLDHELLTMWPLALEIDKGGEINALLDKGLDEPDKMTERAEWARQKRIRCWDKKKLAMELAHKFDMLVPNRTPDFDADMDEYQDLYKDG
jgi:hypothetical protein